MIPWNTALSIFLVSLAITSGYFTARGFYALSKIIFWALCESMRP